MSTPAEFAQLALSFIDPIQHEYEIIRPLVLFAETIAERSRQTGVERSHIRDQAHRFVTSGMFGLADQRSRQSGRKPHSYPERVANYLVYVKHLYPPIHYDELARIVRRKFGYVTNHSTVKRFLLRHPVPVQLPLHLTHFHDFDNAYQARWTVVRMWAEGWSKKSIAGCLQLSRKHVHTIIAAFQRDGFVGLEDQRTRPADHPANQLTLPFLKDVLGLQREYRRAGRTRLHGVLTQRYTNQGRTDVPSERTLGRAMALNRKFHSAPPTWVTDAPSAVTNEHFKEFPYTPVQRHRYWFIDIRYLRQLDDHWTYSICVLEGYSRKILAGMASEYQDEVAVLQLLTAALTEYGCPGGIVSDNGAVFTAHAYCSLLETLGIEPCYIEKGKLWENLLEAQFKVQLRLADAKFEQAQTFEEVQQQHAAFVELFNTTPHWVHREREDGLRTPADVLAWVHGRQVAPDEVRRVVRHLHFERSVRPNGYISIQKFYIYAERGVARHRVSVWLYEGRLQVMYREALLARYAYQYDRKHQQIRSITHPLLFQTPYVSPQLELWELDETQWRKVLERPQRLRSHPSSSKRNVQQLRLALNILTIFLWWLTELHFVHSHDVL